MKNKILYLLIFAFFILSSCSKDDKTAGGITEDQGVAIIDKDIAGVSQKGPFVNGSSIHLYGLDVKKLTQTGSVFTGKIRNDKGDFSIVGINLNSQHALLEATGFYRNEVSGEKSNSPITLYAITDLSKRENVNVNILTHLEYERILYLARNGKPVTELKRQVEAEILRTFYIDEDFESFEDLNIFNSADGDAALLAISILLQGDRVESELSELLANYATDIEEDGVWDDSAAKTAVADWSNKRTFDEGFSNIRKQLSSWNMGDVPPFEKYALLYWWHNYNLGVCDASRQGEVKQNTNELSSNFGLFYTCDDEAWRMSTDIEKDTLSWGVSYETGSIRNGNANGKFIYVFDGEKWQRGSKTDSLFLTMGEKACLTQAVPSQEKFAAVGDTSSKLKRQYYVCSSNGWVSAPTFYNDTYEMRDSCLRADQAFEFDGLFFSSNKYLCENKNIRTMDSTEAEYGHFCASHNIGDYLPGWIDHYGMTYMMCTSNGWLKDPLATSAQAPSEIFSCVNEDMHDILGYIDDDVVKIYGNLFVVCKDKRWEKFDRLCSEEAEGLERRIMTNINAEDGWKTYICKNGSWVQK